MRRLNIELHDDEHLELKVMAAYQSLTIQQAVTEAVRDWVQKVKAAR